MLCQSVFDTLVGDKLPAVCRLLDPATSWVRLPTRSLTRGSFPGPDTSASVLHHHPPAVHPSWAPLHLWAVLATVLFLWGWQGQGTWGELRLSGASVPGILQARILEWLAMPFSRGSS